MTLRKRALIQTLLFIIGITFLPLPVSAEGGVTVTLTPDRSELTVGDPLVFTLAITHPAGYQIIIPQLPQNWGDFEVRSQSPLETLPHDDGSQTTRQTIEATLFAPGDFQTPPLPITIAGESGQISEETAAPVSLTVTPVLTAGDTTLLDIRPQADMAVPPLWPWIVAGLLPAAALLWFLWRLYRRLQDRQSPLAALAVDPRPPYQVAYDELARIEGLHLSDQGRFKEHYTLVTDCLRRYLEGQFQVRAFERTTSELKSSLRQSSLAPQQARRFIELFSESDLVKFAKFIPDLDTARRLTGLARALVDKTKPAPDAETAHLQKPQEASV